MLLLNKKLEYAVISLKHMYSTYPGQLSAAKEISDIYQIPFDTTSRVMQIMAQKGLLRSQHGVRGGYCILENLEEYSLYDLMEMILGPVEISSCLNKAHSDCEIACSCNIISSILYLNQKIIKLYQEISLHRLMTIENDNDAEKIRSSYSRDNLQGNSEKRIKGSPGPTVN